MPQTDERIGLTGELGVQIRQYFGIFIWTPFGRINIGFNVAATNLVTPLRGTLNLGSTGHIPVAPFGAFTPFALPLDELENMVFTITDIGSDMEVMTASSSIMEVSVSTALSEAVDEAYLEMLLAAGYMQWADVFALMTQSEIVVDINDSGEWYALTDNDVADINPVVAVHSDRAVVVWERQVLHQDGMIGISGIDNAEIDGEYSTIIPNVEASSELWFRVFDGSIWLPEVRLDQFAGTLLANYQVVMNEYGVAVVAGAYDPMYDASFVKAYHIDSSGNIAHRDISSRNESSVNSQIVLANDGFFLAYYRLGSEADIIIMHMSDDGVVSNTSRYASDTMRLSISEPSAAFLLISDDNRAAIVSTAHDFHIEGDMVYSMLVSREGNDLILSAPLTVVSPVEGYTLLLSGANLVGNTITAEYLRVKTPESANEILDYFSHGVSSATFSNTFVYDRSYSHLSVAPNANVDVTFSIGNTGLDVVSHAEVIILGNIFTLSGEIPQGASSVIDAVINLGSVVENVPYTFAVYFANGQRKTADGVLPLRKPNISIGNILNLYEGEGRREMTIRLYNDSDVPVGENGNIVSLSFYSDPMREHLVDTVIISDPTKLLFIDNGGLNLFYSYVISQDDLYEGEISQAGIWLYLRAEILNNGVHVEQHSYVNTHAAIGMFSLLNDYDPTAIVSVNATSNNISTEAELHIRNLSMQALYEGYAEIVASLLNENGHVIATQTLFLADGLESEGYSMQHVIFDQAGSSVVATFGPLSSSEPVHAIGISPVSGIVFEAVEVDYGHIAPQTISVFNAGNRPTRILGVTLSGENADSFIISGVSLGTLGVGQILRFTIEPIAGLDVGTHTAVVTVSGDNGVSESIDVSFTVIPDDRLVVELVSGIVPAGRVNITELRFNFSNATPNSGVGLRTHGAIRTVPMDTAGVGAFNWSTLPAQGNIFTISVYIGGAPIDMSNVVITLNGEIIPADGNELLLRHAALGSVTLP
jgi:hypothetical protein